MDVMAEFTIESVESEDHLSGPIADAAEHIEAEGLEFEVGPAGTTVLGELDEVMACLAECHELLGDDASRIKSTIHVDARDDWPPGSIQQQAEKVEERLSAGPA